MERGRDKAQQVGHNRNPTEKRYINRHSYKEVVKISNSGILGKGLKTFDGPILYISLPLKHYFQKLGVNPKCCVRRGTHTSGQLRTATPGKMEYRSPLLLQYRLWNGSLKVWLRKSCIKERTTPYIIIPSVKQLVVCSRQPAVHKPEGGVHEKSSALTP